MAMEDDAVAALLGRPAAAAPAAPQTPALPANASDDQIVQSLLSGAPAAPAAVSTGFSEATNPEIGGRNILEPQQPNAVRDLGDKVANVYSSIRQAVKGNAEFPDIGEVPASFRGKMLPPKPGEDFGDMLGPLLDSARTDEGKFNILKRFFPQAESARDKNGNLMATVDGKTFYLNKPGLSTQDASDLLAMLTFELLPTSGGAAAGGAIGGPIGRLLGMGAGAAAGSLGQDAFAKSKGSKQDEDLIGAAIVGTLTPVLGLAGEQAAKFVRPSVQRLITAIFRKPGAVNVEAGALSAEAAQELTSVGIDPDKISPDMARRIGQLVSQGLDTKTAGRVTQAERLKEVTGVSVPLTKGDVTRSPSQQMFESQASKGGFGEPAEREMQANIAAKDQGLKTASERIQGSLSGAEAGTIDAGEGGASAQRALSVAERAKKTEVDAAYEVARSKTAAVPKEYAQSLWDRAAQNVEDFDVAGLPRAKRVLDDLAEMIDKGGDKVDVGTVLERWRRRATNAAEGATSGEERKAIRKMIEAYDGGIADLVDQSILVGDESTVAAWAKARGLNKEYAQAFKGKDIVQALTDGTVDETGKFHLKVGADDATRLIFGRGKLGANSGLEADLTKLKSLLPETEWNKLREEAFLRLTRSQERGGNRGQNLERLFSGDKFATAVDEAFSEAPGAMGVLFSKPEQEAIQTLKNVALYATNKISGGANVSNTTAALVNFVDKTASLFGPVGSTAQATVARFLKPIVEQAEARRAREAVRGAASAKKRAPLPPSLAAFLGVSGQKAGEGLSE